jgi:hypothetical protein
VSRLLGILAATIAIGFGLLTVVGLLAGDGIFGTFTNLLLQLVVITAAVTLLIGLLNLLGVHLGRLVRRGRGAPYSFVLVASFLLVIGLWLLDRDNENMLLLETVQLSVESALAALLVFALVFGAYRLMRRRVSTARVLFTLAVLIVLLGALPLPEVGFLGQVREWLLNVPVSAGARGLLLGIALATVVTGVRVLIGQEQAYRE